MEPSWNDITPPPPPPPGYYFYQLPGSAGPVWTTTPPPTPPSLVFPTPSSSSSQTPSPQSSDLSSSLRPPLIRAPSPQTSDPSSSHRPLNTEVSLSNNAPSPDKTPSPQISDPSLSLRPPTHVNLELSSSNTPSPFQNPSPQSSDSSLSKKPPPIRAPSPQTFDPFGPWPYQSPQNMECSSPLDSSSSKRPPPIRARYPLTSDPFGPWYFPSSQHMECSSPSDPSSSKSPPLIRAPSPQNMEDSSSSKREPPFPAPYPLTSDPFGPWSFQSPQHMESSSSYSPLPRQDMVTSLSQMPPPFLPQSPQAMYQPSSLGKLPPSRAPAHHLKKPSSIPKPPPFSAPSPQNAETSLTQQLPILHDFLGPATGNMISSSTNKDPDSGPSPSGTKRSFSDVTCLSFSHNPNFNPNQNPNLNPDHYTNLNPGHNQNINPNQNHNLSSGHYLNLNPPQNPNLSSADYPYLNTANNPNLSPNQNPDINPDHYPNLNPAHNTNLNQNPRPILNPNTTQGMQRDTMSFGDHSYNPLQNSNQPKANPTMTSRLLPPPPRRVPSVVEKFTRNCENIRSFLLSLEPAVVPDDTIFPGATKVVFKQDKEPQDSGGISIGGQSTSLESQMVILYGNQTQVVENVHPNKVRQIIHDAQAPLQPVQPYQVSTSTNLQANSTELLDNSAPMHVTKPYVEDSNPMRPHFGSSEVINIEDSPDRTTANESNAQPSQTTSLQTEMGNNQKLKH